MNGLKKQQYELLERIGCKDAADKINELVRYTNDYGKITLAKPIESGYEIESIDDLAEILMYTDTIYDIKKILKDYINKIK